jgi:23S rRNA pseudouridine2605 synthase
MATSQKGIRLQKRLAELGVASRRESERMIAAGRVRVNGHCITVMGTKVQPNDVIEIDGNKISGLRTTMVVALHKPPGTICAVTDPQGRPTIYKCIPKEYPFLSHVGRLDFNTEGLILLTNERDLAEALLDPGNAVPRIYEVKVRGKLSRDQIRTIERGISLDGRASRPVDVEKITTKSKHDWLSITLFEGKNRHIHRLMEAVGTSVSRLRRVSFGPVTLQGMGPEEHRLLENHEVQALRRFNQSG